MKKLFALLVLSILLSGCTVRTAYNYLDWYLAWQIDDYVELNNEQEVLFDRAVDEFINWHRKQELPRYRALLAELKLAIEQQNGQGLQKVFSDSRNLWQTSAEKAAPSIILLLDKLSAEQRVELVENIWVKQQEDHDKWRERAKKSMQQKQQDEVEELAETLGELTELQQQEYLVALSTFTSTREMRIESRQRWLEKFATSLTSNKAIDQLSLYELFTDMTSYRSQEHLAISSANQQKYFVFLSKQLPTLTAKQQKHVISNIDDYLADLDYLIGENS